MWLRALGWLFALIGAICVLVFLSAWGLVAMEALPSLPVWTRVVGGVGAALIALWLFLDWGALSRAGRDQTVQRSATASFAALLALAITVALNAVAHKYDEQWDVTATKRYTLSQQSIDIAKALDREVEVLAFFPTGSPDGQSFRNLMDQYAQHTTLLKTSYHDPYSDPLLVQQMEITSTYGTAILRSGDNQQRLETEFDEEAFTNALVKLTADVEHPVCFVTGHGEMEPDDDSAVGLSTIKGKLEGQNYTVKAITLLEGAPKPADCKVVVLGSPRVDLLPGERDRLAQYVAAGGGLLVLIDPLLAPETAKDLARYGVKVGDDVVIEADPARQLQGGDPTFVVLDEASWDIHPITAKLRGMAFMRLARSVAKGDEIPGLNVQVLAHASEQSWGETNLTDTSAVPNPDAGVDLVGNVPVAAVVEVTDPAAIRTETAPAVAPTDLPVGTPAAEKAEPLPPASGGKVVVFGDADFAGNQLVLNGMNNNLVLNTVAWMVGETEQISIRSNEGAKGKLTVTVATGLLAGIVALLVVPGLAVIGAVGTWLRRRKM